MQRKCDIVHNTVRDQTLFQFGVNTTAEIRHLYLW